MGYKEFFILEKIWHFHFIQSFVSIVIKKVLLTKTHYIFGIHCSGKEYLFLQE